MTVHPSKLLVSVVLAASALTACSVTWESQLPGFWDDLENDPPTLALDSPTTGSTYTSAEAIVFAGTVTDDGALEEIYLTITSNLDGLIDRPDVAADGTFSATATLSVGSHELLVTATDDEGLQAIETLTVLIEDGDGPIVTVSLDPDPPRGDTPTSCTWTAEDPGGLDVDVEATWQVDGVEAGDASFEIGGLTRGAELTCAVVATSASGTTTQSATATVGNSPPVVDSAALEGVPATEETTLTCTATTSDYDEDTVTTTIDWLVDGVVAVTGSATLDGTDFDRDQEVACRVTPNDGTDDGEAVESAATTIENTAPTDPMDVTVDLASVREGGGVTCIVGQDGTDVDPADVLEREVQWKVDGTEDASQGGPLYDTSGQALGAVITCGARMSDGDLASGWSESSDSATVVDSLVGSYAPADASVAIRGTSSDAGFGVSLANVGDIDGSGLEWVAVGAQRYDGNTGSLALFAGADLAPGGDLADTDAQASWTGHASGDKLAAEEAIAGVGDATGGGVADVLVGAYAAGGTGSAYLLEGETLGSGAIGSVADDALYVFEGTGADDWCGLEVGGADLDGDGLAELLVGSPRDDSPGTDAGSVAIFVGSELPASGTLSVTDADHTLTGAADDFAGYGAMEAVGDVDGDGYVDFGIGSRDSVSSGGLTSGNVTLLSGGDFVAGSYGTSETLSSVALARVEGEYGGDWFGLAVATLGDLDDDGLPELAVGARGVDSAAANAGRVYVFRGAELAGTVGGADAWATFEAGSASFLGKTLESGDVDGDGHLDLLVGAHGDDALESNQGTAWLLPGGGASSWGPATAIDGAEQARFDGDSQNDYCGTMNALADLDGDGLPEILVGCQGEELDSADYGGAVFAFFQP